MASAGRLVMRITIPLCTAATVVLLAGCRLLDKPPEDVGRSLLRRASQSPDSVAMEIIWARYPVDDPALCNEAWQEIDETRIPPAVRRELAANGLRAGVIGATIPEPIAHALRLTDQTPEPEPTGDEQNQHAVVDESTGLAGTPDSLLAEPTVRRRHMQLRRGRRVEVQASDVYDSLPLLVSKGRDLGGRTFHDAQAIYALEVDPQPDQTVRVELTPELHYGQPRLRFTSGDEMMFRQVPLREREVFDRMRMEVTLAPGEMLLLMSLPDSGSRLGECFHTVDAVEGRRHKLVLVRLAEVPRSNAFDAPAAF